MVATTEAQEKAAQFASKLAKFELLRRALPFRHPDFSDDQIRQLTQVSKAISRPFHSAPSHRSHSGCSSPMHSPTIQRLRTDGFQKSDGFPVLSRAGSDPLMSCNILPRHAMNTGSLPADLPQPGVPAPSLPGGTYHHPTLHHSPRSSHHKRHHKKRSSRHSSTHDKSGVSGVISSIAGGGAGGADGRHIGDREVLAVLTNKLMDMETKLAQARQAIRQRDFHIAVLEEKVRLCMREEAEGGGNMRGLLDPYKEQRIYHLENRCAKLEHHLLRLEGFLTEYGLTWCEEEGGYVLQPVGGDSSSLTSSRSCSSSSESSLSSGTTPSVSPRRSPRPGRPPPRVKIKNTSRSASDISFPLRGVRKGVDSTSRSVSSEAEPFVLDFDQLVVAVESLNAESLRNPSNVSSLGISSLTSADSGIVTTATGYSSNPVNNVDIAVYKNGIVVGHANAPFRNFDQPSCRNLLQYLMDGIIPDELITPPARAAVIKLKDKRQVIYLPTSARRKHVNRPPVPPRPKISTNVAQVTPATSIGNVSEADIVSEVISNKLQPEIETRTESNEYLSSRRDSLQKSSDKSESEVTRIEVKPPVRITSPIPPSPILPTVISTTSLPTVGITGPSPPPEPSVSPPARVHGCRRGSEAGRHDEIPVLPSARRRSSIKSGDIKRVHEMRRGSDARRSSEVRRPGERRGSEARRGSDARRISEVARRALHRRKSPREWNRMNRVMMMHEELELPSANSQGRRGSIGMVVGGGVTADVDVDTLRSRRSSVQDFLARVPECVVKNGKIVNLREEMSGMLMGTCRKNSLTLVHTPILDEAEENQEEEDEEEEDEEEAKSESEEPVKEDLASFKEEDEYELNERIPTSITAESSDTFDSVFPKQVDTSQQVPSIAVKQQSAGVVVAKQPTASVKILPAITVRQPTSIATKIAPSAAAGGRRKSSIARQPIIITTLRIRAANGSQTYLIKLKASDTLDKLRSYLRSYRDGDDNFEVIRTYPYEVLDRGDATMAELGFVPNATLHLKSSGRTSPPTSLNLPTDMAQALKVITAAGSGSSSKLLGQSGLHGDYSSAIGSSILGNSPTALDHSSLLSGISSNLGVHGLGSDFVHPASSASMNGGLFSLSGIGVPSQSQYYTSGAISAVVAAAAQASIAKDRQPSGLTTASHLSSIAMPTLPAPLGISSLASCSIGAFSTSPLGHSTITSSSIRGTGSAFLPSSTAYYSGHYSRRTSSPALPIIPPNLHPALTSTLPNLLLPDDLRESSSDAS